MFRTSIRLSLTTAALALMAGTAMAAGSDAGSIISNTFSMSYNSGGETITIDDADTAETTVDRKIAYTLVAQTDPLVQSVSPGDSDVELSFMLTNTGNADTTFDLDIAQTFPTNNGIELTYDTAGGEGTWHVVVLDPAIGPSSAQVYDPANLNGITIPQDGQRILAVIASIPDADDLERDDFQFTVRALNDAGSAVAQEDRDGNGVDVVFGDPGQNNIETGTGGFQVEAPVLSATKIAQVVAETPDASFNCATGGSAGNGAAFIPGACIEYQITVQNATTASASATDVYFVDRMPSEVTYVGATIEITGGTSDAFVVLPGGGDVAAEVDQLDPGMSAILRIRATVD
mgnify:CR=1 FL=1